MFTERLNIRLEPEQAQTLERLARERGLKASTLARQVLIQALFLPVDTREDGVTQENDDHEPPVTTPKPAPEAPVRPHGYTEEQCREAGRRLRENPVTRAFLLSLAADDEEPS
jgi:hypothetical protein